MKRISVFSLCLCILLLQPVSVSAANHVDTIDIQAEILPDGSMEVVEVWEGIFDEGTELYIPMNTPDYLTIHDLQVSDERGVYETLPEWKLDRSFEEKADKCGINNTPTGYEVCFGISKYGHNRYEIKYRLDNVIGAYEDRDGVNFRFVNDMMNTTPTDVTVEIRLADGREITGEIAEIWGFGYEGRVEFLDGAIVASTEEPISAQNHVTVMFDFVKGILSPARQEKGSFDTVKEAALEGSDYDELPEEEIEVSSFEVILTLIGTIAVPIGLVVFFLCHGKKGRKKKLSRFVEEQGYFRDIPNEGNANASYVLGKQFEVCEEGSILAMGMLRLIELGCLQPVVEETVGAMGRIKETASLRIVESRHEKMTPYDEYLYTVLESAAGADGILQERELERFSEQNDRLLRDYINKCDETGKSWINKKHCLKRWNTCSSLKDLTPNGEKELGELLGFKKYLEDFSLISEREIREMVIWKDLLSYAMLFGIADKLANQMKELYPDIAPEITVYSQSMTAAYSYEALMYRNMRQAEKQREQEIRSSGGGGFSSIGGGGGSVGGGSGGGTR